MILHVNELSIESVDSTIGETKLLTQSKDRSNLVVNLGNWVVHGQALSDPELELESWFEFGLSMNFWKLKTEYEKSEQKSLKYFIQRMKTIMTN